MMRTTVFVQQVHGAAYPGAERSIASLLAAGLAERLEWLARFGIDVHLAGPLVDDAADAALAPRVEAAASRLGPGDAKLLFLASDHSATPSLLRGLASRPRGGKMGLIHFDAHCDLEDIGKGNAHASMMTDVAGLSPASRPAVQASDVIQIGIRDFSRAERIRAARLRRVITANEVAWSGIGKAVEFAYQALAQQADLIYVTFDLDVISPAELPAVNTPKWGGGLSLAQASAALEYLFRTPKVIGGDLVEYNPSNDDAAASGARAIFELVASASGYQRFLERGPHAPR